MLTMWLRHLGRGGAAALAAAVALAVVALVAVLALLRGRRQRREGFDLGNALKTAFTKTKQGLGTAFNVSKKVAVGAVGGAAVAVKGGGGGAAKYVPTYSGRQWDGQDWSCPWWTVDTGLEDARGCISSQFHSPLWRSDGKDWAWSCPNGTVPTGSDEWDKKCEVGWMGRQFLDGKWQCPWGTEDSGKTWDNSSWADAQKQCRRMRPYTVRANINNSWQCPPGSKDTGKKWGDKGEWDQCKWIGG